MNSYYNQAKHNSEFLKTIEANFPGNFYDWRITVIFYISIHLIKCLAYQRGVNIGETHYDIENSLNPKRSAKQIFPFPEWVWLKYSRIFKYSKSSRYEGISDFDIVLKAQKRNYEECVLLFEDFKSYMKSQKIGL